MILRISYFIIVLAAFLLWNWWLIVIKRRSPNHLAQTFWRFIAWAAGAGLLSHGSWYGGAVLLFAFHFAFWFPFSIGLNLLRHRAWNYIGENAWIDRQARKWPGAFIMFSFIFFVAGVGYILWPI